MSTLIYIGIVIGIVVVFVAGLLVGRRNPKVADQASMAAEQVKASIYKAVK